MRKLTSVFFIAIIIDPELELSLRLDYASGQSEIWRHPFLENNQMIILCLLDISKYIDPYIDYSHPKIITLPTSSNNMRIKY